VRNMEEVQDTEEEGMNQIYLYDNGTMRTVLQMSDQQTNRRLLHRPQLHRYRG